MSERSMGVLQEADELRKVRDEAAPARPDWHARLVRKDYPGVSMGLSSDIDAALDRITYLEVELEYVKDVLRRHSTDNARVLQSVASILRSGK